MLIYMVCDEKFIETSKQWQDMQGILHDIDAVIGHCHVN